MMDHGGMGPGSMQGGGMQGGMKQGGMRQGNAMGPDRMSSMTEGRLAFLKAELQINEAQEGAWKEYSDAVRNRVAVMQDMRTQMMKTMQDGNAIARMDAHINGMQAMLDAMKAVKPATTKLYEALGDEQKKNADQLIGLECGAM